MALSYAAPFRFSTLYDISVQISKRNPPFSRGSEEPRENPVDGVYFAAAFFFMRSGLVAYMSTTARAMRRNTALIGEVRNGTKLP